MRKEIGSNFWDIPISDKENDYFSNDICWFISGRAALNAILHTVHITKIALPSYCCESMIIPFILNGIDYEFYDVSIGDGTFVCNYEDVSDDCDGILLMSYFGYKSNDGVKKKFNVIIRDITHSVFTIKYNDADYYYGSVRKWAGFCGGGFAFGRQMIKQPQMIDLDFYDIKKFAIKQKSAYMNGLINDKTYLRDFATAEGMLDNCKIVSIDNSDIFAAKKLDVDYIKSKHRINAEYVMEKLNKYCVVKNLSSDDCPLYVPIIIDKKYRDKVRNMLKDNNIYCPIHWPYSDYHKISAEQREIYDKELSLVCDQRYDLDDMERMCNKAEEAIKTCCA